MSSRSTALSRALENRNVLGLLFLLPAAALLLIFLTYPLGLGTYLGFTDAKIGRGGEWIGLENYEFLWGDQVTRLAQLAAGAGSLAHRSSPPCCQARRCRPKYENMMAPSRNGIIAVAMAAPSPR